MPAFPWRNRAETVSAAAPSGVGDDVSVAVADGPAGEAAPRRGALDMSRRRFLRHSTLTAGVAAVGLAGVLPPILPDVEDDGTATSGAAASVSEAAPAASADASGVTSPVTAHISDLESGDLKLFVEDRTILLHDPELATRILQATR